MRKTMLWGVPILAVLLAFPAAFAEESAGADTDWRPEFEAVCSQTDTSSALGDEALARLIARCDKLAERIGAEAEVVRRVYLKRLQRCRDLFAFVLESRKAAAATTDQATSPPEAPAAPPAAPPAVTDPH